jgi:hypothetical protein
MNKKIWTVIYSIDTIKQHESIVASSKREAVHRIINSKKQLIKILDVFLRNNI